MAKEYDFEKLTREIIASRLPAVSNSPDAAAEIAKKIIISGVKSTSQNQEPHHTVVEVCRGILDGMLILNQDLVKPAICLLKLMHDIAQETHLDSGEMMTWAMEGIAAAASTSGSEMEHRIQSAIDENFMGAGEVFAQFSHKIKNP